MRYIALVFIFLLTAIAIKGQTVKDSLMFDDIQRYYNVYVPENVQDQSDLPLVFTLHGAGSSASQQEAFFFMNEVADTAGFIVCYPDGINKVWNSGFSPNGVDDAGFINALIDKLDKDYAINLDKVYSCGMSNGGYQSLYMACELTNRFAAVASVTGSMAKAVLDNCTPSRAIPVMQIHGTSDSTVLYNGSAIAAPIEEVVKFWVENNQCNPIGDTLQIENIDTTDSSTAERIAYTEGLHNSEVIFYKITNGGHTWPGSSRALAALGTFGNTNFDFSASEVIWNFFNRYALSDTIPLSLEIDSFASVELFPNPFNDFIYLKGEVQFDEVQLIDLNGQLLQQTFADNSNSLNKLKVNHLNNGIYLVKLISKDRVYIHKIIKNE